MSDYYCTLEKEDLKKLFNQVSNMANTVYNKFIAVEYEKKIRNYIKNVIDEYNSAFIKKKNIKRK